MLDAICFLINEHIFGRIELHPETLTALTDLLGREVQRLDHLDYALLDPEVFAHLESKSS